ncbi:MAG: FadR family transcriptional regulator, partial [Pseudonocardia sp.]|nr:FadR family transcriptional regulator [Pseudonocardia sp.]
LKTAPGRALPEVIADKLRELVDEGVYKPGGRLPNESELARNLKVARSSVRTALQRLEGLRVLEVRRGRGWYVRRTPAEPSAPMDPRAYQISDLFELRIGLEALAVSLAAVRITEDELENLAKINKQHEEADDQEEALRTDLAFHGTIIWASRNTPLEQTYHGIIGELTEWRYQSFAGPGLSRRSAREHGKVLRYLRNHDSGGARVAMNGHLQRLYDELPEIGEEPLDTTEGAVGQDPEWRGRS